MKRKYFIFFILVIGITCAFTFRSSIHVENKSFHKLHEGYNYSLDVSYPKVYNEENSDYHINISVQQIMTSAITDFQQKVSRIKPKEGGENDINSLNFNYKILTTEDGFFSVKFSKKTKFIVFDNERELIKIFNYNINKNKLLFLNDLFIADSNFETQLMKIVNSKVNGCSISDPTILNDFNISKEYLIINMENNKKVSKKCQQPINISWKEIKHLINQTELKEFISLK